MFIIWVDLAGEMYQISQMLRDQKNLVQSLLDTSIVAKKPAAQVAETPTETDAKPFVTIKVQQQADEASRKKMLGVLEKVEGASVSKEKR
jgi:hypothetical protein